MRSTIYVASPEVLPMDVLVESEYRVRIGKQIKYISMGPGHF